MQNFWETYEATARVKECGGSRSAARGSKLKQSVAARIVAVVGRKSKCNMQLAIRRASPVQWRTDGGGGRGSPPPTPEIPKFCQSCI